MSVLEEFRLLLQLVVFARECRHVNTDQDAQRVDAEGDRWCLACGSARMQGQWLVPGWMQAFDRQMVRWNMATLQRSEGPVS